MTGPGGVALAEVGILIVDDDVVSQRALKNILDSEGWRVRVVPLASAAMLELASGEWSLVIVNVAMTDVRPKARPSMRHARKKSGSYF